MVGGTRAVSIDPDSEQSTSDLVLSKGNTKSNCNPFLIRESAAPQPSSPALRDRCCHLYLDRAVVVIDGMTVYLGPRRKLPGKDPTAPHPPLRVRSGLIAVAVGSVWT